MKNKLWVLGVVVAASLTFAACSTGTQSLDEQFAKAAKSLDAGASDSQISSTRDMIQDDCSAIKAAIKDQEPNNPSASDLEKAKWWGHDAARKLGQLSALLPESMRKIMSAGLKIYCGDYAGDFDKGTLGG